MKKNLVIVVLLLAVLGLGCLVLDVIPDRTAESVTRPPVIESPALVPAIHPIDPPLVHIVPVSEVDRKLQELGFGTSAEVHQITVK